jgi:hypothetical protein
MPNMILYLQQRRVCIQQSYHLLLIAIFYSPENILLHEKPPPGALALFSRAKRPVLVHNSTNSLASACCHTDTEIDPGAHA